MGLIDSALNSSAQIAGAGIGAGASLLGSIGGMIFNNWQANKQRDWNEKMLNQQNAWNEEMWNKTNEYNSPTAQMERLRDAGLNPLYYGLDGSSAGNIESAQPLGYERATVGNIDNPIVSGTTIAQQIAQISNIQANTAKTNEETLTEVARREKLLAEVETTKQELQNMLAQEGLTNAERAEIEKRIEWADRLNQAIVSEKEANTKLSESQRSRIDALLKGEKLIQAKTLEDFEHKWAKIDAEIDKMAEETDLLKEDIENYALNHANNGVLGSGISLNNLIRGFKQSKKNYDKLKENGGTEVSSVR